MAHNLKSRVDYWVTINEPNVYAFQNYFWGVFPAQKKNPWLFLKVYRNLIIAHQRAYTALHAILKTSQVGYSHNVICLEPRNKNSLIDRFLTLVVDYFHHRWFLQKSSDYLDFLGVQYYFHTIVSFSMFEKLRQLIYQKKPHFVRVAKKIFLSKKNKKRYRLGNISRRVIQSSFKG